MYYREGRRQKPKLPVHTWELKMSPHSSSVWSRAPPGMACCVCVGGGGGWGGKREGAGSGFIEKGQ